ncbi:hypothetical protein Acr_13g0000870 [Actinidia rufa]|uniref:Uncharacterized protein n=1 Tax=Actinidia rufa TaxID=165716 RepID=A0A7J0FJS9_9ERIC|nr:hypothetical protein Acr_13g0000870 [Actinidia rufa]
MSGSGGFAVSRIHGEDRFYNAPAIRRHQDMLSKPRQIQKQLRKQANSAVAEAENRSDSDDSLAALLKPPSVCSSSPPRPPPTIPTNFDRLVECFTPYVNVKFLSEVNSQGRRNRESDLHLCYCLGDLWDSFAEWSVYGVGVPLVLNGKDPITQYYVPSLSGIQLYGDQVKSPWRLRRPGEDSGAESSREASCGDSSYCEADRQAKCAGDGLWSQQKHSHQTNRFSLRDKPLTSSSSYDAENCNSPGTLLFQYIETESPHTRRALTDKASSLLGDCCVQLDFHLFVCLEMDIHYTFPVISTGNGQLHFHGESSKNSLPVFGLASYKLKDSILTPSGPAECQREKTLMQAADNWIQQRNINLNDYNFFRIHYSSWGVTA